MMDQIEIRKGGRTWRYTSADVPAWYSQAQACAWRRGMLDGAHVGRDTNDPSDPLASLNLCPYRRRHMRAAWMDGWDFARKQEASSAMRTMEDTP